MEVIKSGIKKKFIFFADESPSNESSNTRYVQGDSSHYEIDNTKKTIEITIRSMNLTPLLVLMAKNI